MNKSELIDQVAEKAQTTKAAAARAVEAIFDATSGTIAEAVKAGRQVTIPGFGKFRPRTRAARKGRNPRTGAEIQIPEKTVVAFTPGKGLRETIGGKAKGKKGGASKAKTTSASKSTSTAKSKTTRGGAARRSAKKK